MKAKYFLVLLLLLNFVPVTWAADPAEVPNKFRNYKDATDKVEETYRKQHTYQTVEFVQSQHEKFDQIMKPVTTRREKKILEFKESGVIRFMTVWEALEQLDNLVDESDPDLGLPNSVHALQSAEAVRKDLSKLSRELNIKIENLDWLVLVALIHDIGKVDALLRTIPQWAVVGDTFPVGCSFAFENIYPEYFESNPDKINPKYNSKLGVYKKNTGLDNILMSWGHDEYGYQVLKNQGNLPEIALKIIRYHSFYPWHTKRGYKYLCNDSDKETLRWVKVFNKYDLYSKSEITLDRDKLKNYYLKLINKYFPPEPGREAKKLIWPVLDHVAAR